MARPAPAPAKPLITIQPAHLGIVAVVFVALIAFKFTRKTGPDQILQNYIALKQDVKTKNEAMDLELEGTGSVQAHLHMGLEHLTANDLPGSRIVFGKPQVSGDTATVNIAISIGGKDLNVPATLQLTDTGWKIDLTKTNDEIIKIEAQLNQLSGKATTSSGGGLSPGSASKSATGGR